MKKTIIYSGISIILIVLFFVLRGTPKSKIPYPDLVKTDKPKAALQKGRPIPYHEVFLGYRNWFGYEAILYNDLNDVLTPKEWASLDKERIRKETGASIVMFNGPRFWVLDEILGESVSPIGEIQGHKMLIPAHFRLTFRMVTDRKPYNPFPMNRDTKYVYYANDYLYKLIGPDGTEYVMQAASQELENLQLKDLKNLGSKLKLADGWQYKAEMITEQFINESGGHTTIVQDNLRNTYQVVRK